MKKILLLLTLLLISQVSAIGPIGENGIEIFVQNNTITIQGYTIIGVPFQQINGQVVMLPQKFVSSTSNLFINRINENIVWNKSCSDFNYTQGNESYNIFVNCSLFTDYYKELPFINLGNYSNGTSAIVTDSSMQSRYDSCVAERAMWENSFNNCMVRERESKRFEGNLSICSTDLTNCQIKMAPLQDKVDTLTKEKEDTKNKPMTFGVIGAILGFIGAMVFSGQWLGQKAKHYEQDFNRGAAQ